jgi:hypothetical protein
MYKKQSPEFHSQYHQKETNIKESKTGEGREERGNTFRGK